MISGDFEIHLTGSEWEVGGLAAFARSHGVKFSHIVLARGATPVQPMLTVPGSGTLAELRGLAERWKSAVVGAGLHVLRVKVEAAPWNDGVPRSDEDAPPDRYFEHHVKVLLPTEDREARYALSTLVEPHDARVSRNARREHDDSREERFVTQRCPGVGRATASARLKALVTTLESSPFEVLEVEEEYVVDDDALHVDRGWFTSDDQTWWHHLDERARTAPAGTPDYPSTYLPLRVEPGRDIRQRAAFEPAVKQFSRAFRAGEPVFGDPAEGLRWRAARRAAMAHVLALVAASPSAGNLVLRGSVLLKAWYGDAAREPGDLDFVVVPTSFAHDGPQARDLLAGLVAGVAGDPGPGLRADLAVSEHIWTYERVPGRRLVFPFDVEGLPQGTVQVDLVFGEPLPEPPVTAVIPPLGTSVLAASPGLSLAWKLQWLATDMHPQGKDLYDAVLLAEHTTVSLDLVRELIRPELAAEADGFTAASVLEFEVDWDNFRSDRPDVEGDLPGWLRRLADALARP